MKPLKKSLEKSFWAPLLASAFVCWTAAAQQAVFTYQGRLTYSGAAANGPYDLLFSLWDADTAGHRVGEPLTNAATTVSNGCFFVELGYDADAFNGGARWLEIGVKPNGTNGTFSMLSPRQKITATPYALRALNAANAESVLAQNIIGALASAQLPGSVVTNNATSVTLMGQFSGNGSGLTNLPGSSFTKIISLTPPTNGDTNWFGPWTPGTKTAGIQEAIQSLPTAPNPFSAGGGALFLTPGTYFATETIEVNFTNPFSLTIIGPGMNAGGIVYVGSVPKSVMRVGAPFTYNRLIFKMENLFMASALNATTNVLFFDGKAPSIINWSTGPFGGVNRATVRDCWFGWWTAMTNNPLFGFSMARLNDSAKHNLVGVDVQCNFDEPILLENCSFTEVIGVGWASDHGTIRGCNFQNTGISPGTPFNDWPASSPFSVGASVVCMEPPHLPNGNKVWHFEDNYFINSALAYFSGTAPSAIAQVSYNDQIEGGQDFVAGPGIRWTAINPFSSTPPDVFANNFLVTNLSNFSTWRTQRDTTNMVNVFDLRAGKPGTLAYSIVSSNALLNWPPRPSRPGDVAFVNSNGFPYVLLSTNGNGGGSPLWTSTNRFGW